MTLNPAKVVLRFSIQLLGILALLLTVAIIHIYPRVSPYMRGFYCDDEGLKKPYTTQTVPMEVCGALWFILTLVIMIPIEVLREMSRGSKDHLKVCGVHLPWIFVELYRHLGYGLMGVATMFIFTDTSKLTIGRLRPHFLTLCQPDYSDPNVCLNNDYNKYVTADVCRGVAENMTVTVDNVALPITERMMKEARLSFMSGHASSSFFCAVFLGVFLQARLNKFPNDPSGSVETIRHVLKNSRPFIQFGLLILAFWISLTRISDYFHHPLDVFTGALVGITFALVTHTISGIFEKQTAFWRSTQGQLLESNQAENKSEVKKGKDTVRVDV